MKIQPYSGPNALRKYMNVDLNILEGHTVFVTHFINQSAPDITGSFKSLSWDPKTPSTFLLIRSLTIDTRLKRKGRNNVT